MRLTGAWLVIATLALSIASASPDPGFSASSIDVLGESRVDGTLAALYAHLDGASVSWEATAAKVVVDRRAADYTQVYQPLKPEANAYSNFDPRWETLEFGASTLASTASRPAGAFLLWTQGESEVAATADGLVLVTTASNPAFHQIPPDSIDDASSAIRDYYVLENAAGRFLNITVSDGAYEIRGDLEMQLSEVDYRLMSEGTTFDGVTGFLDAWSTGAARQGHVEKHVISLIDAVVRVRIDGAAALFTTDAVLAFHGEMHARDAQGELSVGGDDMADGTTPRASLDGSMQLSPDGNLVLATATSTQAAAIGAIVPEGARLPAWAAATLGALLLVALAVVLVRRRRDRVDDLDAAILAMEEQRWRDAVPHLERVLAKRPADTGLRVDHALCLERSGRLAQARAGYERALREAPDHAEANFYFARTLARLQENALARAHLDRALALDPRLREIARGEQAFRRVI